MNRREAIQRATLALGYAISTPALLAVLNGCKATPKMLFTPVFFNEAQAQLVSALAEIILPKTSTPGATEVGVPAFIDLLLKEVYPPEDQQKFLSELTFFDQNCEKAYGSKFIDCTVEKQMEYFGKLHAEAMASVGNGGSTGWWNTGQEEEKSFILKIKELTLLGFFTSEPGATQVLQYSQAPGPYQGCVPLQQVGRAWAT